tara:strand:+ start:6720 stop:7424 length:705 start_codon:yes stop_codon:yes gene_type:complete
MTKDIIKKYSGNDIKVYLNDEIKDQVKDLTGYMVHEWAKHYPSDKLRNAKEFIRNRVDLLEKDLRSINITTPIDSHFVENVFVDPEKIFDILYFEVENSALEIFEYNDDMWKDYLFINGYETEFNEPEDEEYTWEENAVTEHGDDLHIVCADILKQNFSILQIEQGVYPISRLKTGMIGMMVEVLAGYRTDTLFGNRDKTPEQELLEMVENKIWDSIQIEITYSSFDKLVKNKR